MNHRIDAPRLNQLIGAAQSAVGDAIRAKHRAHRLINAAVEEAISQEYAIDSKIRESITDIRKWIC